MPDPQPGGFRASGTRLAWRRPVGRSSDDPAAASTRYTNKANTIAVVSDGSRVLGLGNIGPEAGLPVMEGKALLFKYLGGVDADAACASARQAPDDIVQTVELVAPSFRRH